MDVLDELDRRIVAALQVDARATWRRIAEVLDEPERTVARRGQQLLTDGRVRVAGVRRRNAALIVRATCAVGAASVAGEGLAQRHDSTFVYTVTGAHDVVAELHVPASSAARLMTTELAAIPGIVRLETIPIMRYFQTIRGWRLGILSREQLDALGGDESPSDILMTDVTLSDTDEAIAACLVRDGRMGHDDIARAAGVSEATARRRVAWLVQSGIVPLRALVEPALVGLGFEALLWIRVPPSRIEAVGLAFARHPRVRYAAAIAGSSQLIVDVTTQSMAEFYELLTSPEWSDSLDVIVTMVVSARKRGGRLLQSAD